MLSSKPIYTNQYISKSDSIEFKPFHSMETFEPTIYDINFLSQYNFYKTKAYTYFSNPNS